MTILHITADDRVDLAIPGASYGFGKLKSAQASGDFAALARRGRRIIRVHLGADVQAGLRRVIEEL